MPASMREQKSSVVKKSATKEKDSITRQQEQMKHKESGK